MALKACRECSKMISGDANPCPFCGKKNPHGMSKLVKYGGGTLGVIVLIGIITPSAGTKERRSDDVARTTVATSPAALTVDAVKLWKDYDANEVAADSMYKGKILRVSGIVSSIDKDFLNDIVLHLESPNPFAHTMAKLEQSQASKAAALSKGASVTVVCEGMGLILKSPSLHNCKIND